MPRFSTSETQQLVLGVILGWLVPFAVLVAASAAALGRREWIARLQAAHRLLAGAARFVLLPGLVLLVLLLLWGAADQSRAVNLILVGVLGGVIGTLLMEVALFAGYSSGLFPFLQRHRLGRLLLGYEASAQAVRAAGWGLWLVAGASFGIAYGTMIGNVDWWWGLAAGFAGYLLNGLTPPMALAGGGPLLLRRGAVPSLVQLGGYLLYGIALGVIVMSYGTTRGLLVATLNLGGG